MAIEVALQPKARAKKARDEWVDVAKALSILLVVYHHAGFLHTPSMQMLDDAFVFFRMPVFFFVSGIYIKKLMSYRFSEVLALRVAPLVYLYAFWSLVKWASFETIHILKRKPVDVHAIGVIFWQPLTTLWFIYALAIFSFVAWLCRRAPSKLVIGVAFVVAAASLAYGPVADGDFIYKLGRNFLWFWLGYVYRDLVLNAVRSRFSWMQLAIVPTWFALSYALVSAGVDLRWWAIVMTAAALPAGIILAAGLARSKAGALFSYLGRNTLPVYVAHFVPLLAIEQLSLRDGWGVTIFAMIAAIMIALLARSIAQLLRLGWLYDLPMPVRYRIERMLRGELRPATAQA